MKKVVSVLFLLSLYAVGTAAFQINYVFFQKWEGTEQKRVFVLEGDKFNPPTTKSNGGGEVIWKR